MSTATPRAQFHQKNLRQPTQHAAVENQLHNERHRPEETTLYRLAQEHTELSLHKLRRKPVQGYLTWLKTNLRHFVAFWPIDSYAHVVQAAPMRNCWPFPASGVDFVPRAVGVAHGAYGCSPG